MATAATAKAQRERRLGAGPAGDRGNKPFDFNAVPVEKGSAPGTPEGSPRKQLGPAGPNEFRLEMVDGKPQYGTQCTGQELLERYAKESGTQLSRAEAKRLAMGVAGLIIKRPQASYLVVKLLAEILDVTADLELKAAALYGKPMDKRLAAFRVLGCINKSLMPNDKHKELEEGKAGAGLVMTADDETYVRDGLAKFPKTDVKAMVEGAIKKRSLLRLPQLVELMYVLGKNLQSNDSALHSQVENLSTPFHEGEQAVVAEEDVDHYFRLTSAVKGQEAFHHFLIYGPRLAEECGQIVKGQVILKRQNQAKGIAAPPATDWTTIKVIAILFDVLAHMQDASNRMVGTPGTKFHLACLGAINRTFMTVEQKKDVISGKRASLDCAEMEALKEISTASKHASINPKKHVSRGGRKIQKHILENYIFNLDELVDLFTDLAHRFFIPAELYKGLVKELVAKGMLKETHAVEIEGKITTDEKRMGVHMFNVAHLFTVNLEMKDEWMGHGESEEGSSTGGSEASQAADDYQCTDVQVPILLLHDFVILKRRGPRRSEFHMEAYQRAIGYLETATMKKADDKKTALGYLKSAVDRKRPLPLVELSYVINLMGSGRCIAKFHYAKLLAELQSQKLISKVVHDTLLTTPTPLSPIALRIIFDKLIAEKD